MRRRRSMDDAPLPEALARRDQLPVRGGELRLQAVRLARDVGEVALARGDADRVRFARELFEPGRGDLERREVALGLALAGGALMQRRACFGRLLRQRVAALQEVGEERRPRLDDAGEALHLGRGRLLLRAARVDRRDEPAEMLPEQLLRFGEALQDARAPAEALLRRGGL